MRTGLHADETENTLRARGPATVSDQTARLLGYTRAVHARYPFLEEPFP
jgi:hypothetical protein